MARTIKTPTGEPRKRVTITLRMDQIRRRYKNLSGLVQRLLDDHQAELDGTGTRYAEM